jgi:hypothetical protein
MDMVTIRARRDGATQEFTYLTEDGPRVGLQVRPLFQWRGWQVQGVTIDRDVIP